jgi:hypothetical protein
MFHIFLEVIMKILFVLFVFFLSFLVVESINAKQQVWVSQEWINEEWSNTDREIIVYDGDNISMATFQEWDGSDWVNDSRMSYSYNSKGQATSYTYEYYEESAWVIYSRVDYIYEGDNIVKVEMYYNEDGEFGLEAVLEYTYNAKGLMISSEYYMYDEGEAMLFSKNVYSYDASDREIEEIYYSFDFMTFELKESSKTTYSYQGNSKNPSIETDYSWEEEVWTETNRRLYEYNAAGNETELILQIWNGQWNNWERTETQWNKNNETQIIIQMWEDDKWENSSKEFFEYNNDDLLTRSVSQFWDWNLDVWTNSYESMYYYDEDGEYLILERTWEGNEWINAWRYFRDGAVSVNDLKNIINLEVFPNPTASSLNLSFSLEKPEFVRANIFSIQAKSNMTVINDFYQNGEHTEIIDVNELANGAYMVNFQIGTKSYIKKFVVNK